MSLDDPNLSSLIKRHATRHAAPDALRAGIHTPVSYTHLTLPTILRV